MSVETKNFNLLTNYIRWTIGTDGQTKHFMYKKDYAYVGLPFASVKKANKIYYVSKAAFANSKITASFGDSGITAVIGVRNCGGYLTFEVLSVKGKGVEELAFLTIDLKLNGAAKEPVAVCALALNLLTNVDGIPGATGPLRASCVPRFGMVGAKVAVIACPTNQLRNVMQEVITAAPDLPHSNIGGPWAYNNKNNQGSYVFNFNGISEEKVDSWIKMVKEIGLTQIDFHGGVQFRWGDCQPDPNIYPNGRESLKAIIHKLHGAGILAGLHTYAFFISKETPWVTPRPRSDLAKDANFTLAKDISDTDTVVEVIETTKDMSTTHGNAIRNSVTIQVDDELITYDGVSKGEPYSGTVVRTKGPYSFTGCKRGENGTKAVAHIAGSKVYHLKECFGLFAPHPDSKLFMDVIQANADMYNECGFDMMYLDALDGEDVLGGKENSWHYGSKFVFELVKRMNEPAIMEMSTFHHHLWFVRSRYGAWDYPIRGYKKWVDLHAEWNKRCVNMFLPPHLGWWCIITSNSPYTEATYTDDMEYLLAKCAGWDCGLSPMGFTPENYVSSYNLRRLGGLIKKWEDLRLSGYYFTETDKAKLKEPGSEFTIIVDENGNSQVRRKMNNKHKVEDLNHETSTWTVSSSFASQPARLRILALNSVSSYDDPAAVTLVEFKEDTKTFGVWDLSSGVNAGLVLSTEVVIEGGDTSGCITAYFNSNAPGAKVTQTWVQIGQKYNSLPTGLQDTGALGCWIYGDGKGELLNFQIGGDIAIADHYVTIDFMGWRYFEFVEPEGDRVNDYTWPYTWPYEDNSFLCLYALYREDVSFANLRSFSIWCNNLPQEGSITCYISPIKALPLVSNKLVNPAVTINGKTVIFPVEIDRYCYLEYNSPTDCKLFKANGDLQCDVTPEFTPISECPVLANGENQLQFTCESATNGSIRAMITVTGIGELI